MGGQKGKASLGQALIRQQNALRGGGANGSSRYQKRKNKTSGVVESVIDPRDLDTVMEQAELAGRIFSSSHPTPHVFVADETEGDERLSPEAKEKQKKTEEKLHQSRLRIPRRPSWHSGMTPEELDIKERQSFLEWRRELVSLEENEKLVVTPFEKNLEIWRQLWRVIERSDLVVTVVDARNPLFYRCPDLEAYVQEMDPYKKTVLLVNKADLLPESARLKWANYFRSQNISFLFWSAKNATAKLEGNAKLDLSLMDEGSSDKEVRILGREELLDTLESKAKFVSLARKEALKVSMANSEMHSDMKGLHHEEDQKNVLSTNKQVVVGFVGYPNVGKSSTINALVGEKRTGVTSTPGKTKHFQTLLLSEGLMLCDCPGLVFPSFTSSRSEMVACGVLPIDRLTDHRGPVQAIANLVPRHVFEDLYGFSLPKPKPYEPQDRPPTAYELLHAFCLSRGYVAGAGLADETRAARMMLKDYVNGKLLHYHLPPRDEEEESNSSGDDSDDEKDASTEDTDEAVVYEGVMNHLDSFEAMAGMKAAATAPSNKMLKDVKAHKAHKMHKKPPRTKDRSWRVRNDDEDGMPLVRGVAKPVSYGAARLAQVKNG